MTYYHVPHKSYEVGEDILTLAAIIEERWGAWGWIGDRDMGWGKTPCEEVEAALRGEWLYKWDQPLVDYMAREDAEGVSLYTSLDDAKRHLRSEAASTDGRVLAVELPEDEVGVNSEGFAFYAGSIPADCIKELITVEGK